MTKSELTKPRLADIFRMQKDAIFARLHVAQPGTVIAYYPTAPNQHTADIQLTLLDTAIDGATPLPPQILRNVPIVHPRTAGAAILMPVNPTDLVTVLFSDKGLDRWRLSTGKTAFTPESNRMHHLSDCWAFLGGYSPGAAPFTGPAKPNALMIYANPGVGIYMGNAGAELFNQMDLMLTQLNTLFTQLATLFTTLETFQVTGISSGGGTSGPPSPAAILSIQNVAAAIVTVQSSIAAVKTALDTLKVA